MSTKVIACDVGYGFVKAVSDTGKRVTFPSLVAPDRGDSLGVGDLFGRPPGHTVSLRPPGGGAESYLVGEAARASFLASGFLGAEKPAEMHDVLLLAACYLAGAGSEGHLPGQVPRLAVGLPLALYRPQRDALRERLSRLAAWASVDGGPERYFSFREVRVYPQGVGVVFAQDGLPGHGFAGVVDVGHLTVDYLLVDLEAGRPVPEASGSLEVGCHLLAKEVARAFREAAGEPLPHRLEGYVLRAAAEGRPVGYRGRELDLSRAYREAAAEVAAAVSKQVLSAWADWAKFITLTLLAGGGALALGAELARSLPSARVVDDPAFANALGFLRMASR